MRAPGMKPLLRRSPRRYATGYATRFASRVAPWTSLEIAPGLWRWTGFHEEWKEDVGCVYFETEDGVVLIDPLVPPEDADRFWKALDRDVRRRDAPVHVLVTVFWHTRSAAAMRRALRRADLGADEREGRDRATRRRRHRSVRDRRPAARRDRGVPHRARSRGRLLDPRALGARARRRADR